ncbi:hypothetical protein [Psychromicrobium lacuslunae]|uniref:Uncharacterized protein n=1 Tax=Psychromicrobium lacuslunae TaxID=1618207 RepID=A0A0D4BYY5_9MICC|nr:hypothetical protein [Psychromicrobium lacuslunae]AJT41509.1 hypothetical protein UM93_08260 [Psychromicrobium lacuslunae]
MLTANKLATKNSLGYAKNVGSWNTASRSIAQRNTAQYNTAQQNKMTLGVQRRGFVAVLTLLLPLGLSLLMVPLLGQQNLSAALIATATVAALSSALSFVLISSAARPAAVRLARTDYPGPERFRVADDPLLSGRPGPRAPASCRAA